MSNRRRMLMKQVPSLLLWLDGINNTRNGHDESSQNWEDLSGNGNDFLQHFNSATWNYNSFVGNGTSTSATLALSNAVLLGKKQFTVEVCARWVSNSSTSWAFQSRQVSNNADGFLFVSRQCTVMCPKGTNHSLPSEKTPSINQIGTLAFSYANGVVKMYSMGELADSFYTTDAEMLSITERTIYSIGSTYPWYSSGHMWLNGNLYSVKIYDGELTEPQMLEAHQNNIARFS